jgi:hypothetical protein
MIIKVLVIIINNIWFTTLYISGMGIRIIISMSKTIKIIARRKNRIENGTRALFLGSKPHSKGDDFSRSMVFRADKSQAMAYTNIGIIHAKINDAVIRFIY